MVHMNPRLAVMSGLDPQRMRLQVFLLAAPISAMPGWLYAYQRAYVGPDLFDTSFLVLMLTAVILVGRAAAQAKPRSSASARTLARASTPTAQCRTA